MLAVLLVALSLTNAAPAPAPKTVTEADSGKTVTIAKHQMLKIVLDECRGSCGYSWSTIATPDPAILTRRSVTHFEQPCPTEGPCPTGRPANITFRYEGIKSGSTTLRLGYFGPGIDHKQADTFRLSVRVR